MCAILPTILECCYLDGDGKWPNTNISGSCNQAGITDVLFQVTNGIACISGVDGDVSQVEAPIDKLQLVVGDESIVIINQWWLPG